MKRIIILHGWTKNRDKWQNFLATLEKKGIKAEFPKVPGPIEGLDRVWKLENYVQWLKNITDKEKGEVILIGQSNGGRISLAFANLYPEKVEKLVLIDSAGIYHNELSLKIKRLIFGTIAKIGKKITSSKSAKNLLYKLARESDYKDLDKNVKQTMQDLITSDLKPILGQISIPTFIIWGREDKITPLSDGKMMNELIKNSKLEIIEGARHSPQFTHPDILADIIAKILK